MRLYGARRPILFYAAARLACLEQGRFCAICQIHPFIFAEKARAPPQAGPAPFFTQCYAFLASLP